MSWRVGRHYPIHLYDGDEPIGTMLTPEAACRAVEAVNGDSQARALLAEFAHCCADEPRNVFRYVQEETVLRDCGQRGVCRTPPGCARHWEERNRELVRENEVLRSNSDHLSSENASLARQVESMAMRIESLAEELAKPEDVRLREVLNALDGRAVIFDGLGARVGHLLDEMDEWIERAGEAERLAEERLAHANQLQADIDAEQEGRLALRKRLGARDDHGRCPRGRRVVSEIPFYPDECEHGESAPDRCWRCLRADLAEAQADRDANLAAIATVGEGLDAEQRAHATTTAELQRASGALTRANLELDKRDTRICALENDQRRLTNELAETRAAMEAALRECDDFEVADGAHQGSPRVTIQRIRDLLLERGSGG